MPTGEQYSLQAGDYRVVVAAVGATLREMSYRDRPVIDGFGVTDLADGARGQTLMPWPNRVAGGRYSFGGRTHQLDISEPDRDCAIHGLVRWDGWHPVDRSETTLVLAHRLFAHQGYPFVLDLRMTYELDAGAGLVVRAEATNAGAAPAPYAAGSHPYLTVGTDRIDGCELRVPAGTWLPTDKRGIPTGEAEVAGSPYDFRDFREIGDLEIDYTFTALRRDADQRATLSLRDTDSGRVSSLWVDPAVPYLEVFTGDTLAPARRRRGLGSEPMTAPPNAFATGTGVVVLKPGQTHTATWGIHAVGG